jgi:hypothetical protein
MTAMMNFMIPPLILRLSPVRRREDISKARAKPSQMQKQLQYQLVIHGIEKGGPGTAFIRCLKNRR